MQGPGVSEKFSWNSVVRLVRPYSGVGSGVSVFAVERSNLLVGGAGAETEKSIVNLRSIRKTASEQRVSRQRNAVMSRMLAAAATARARLAIMHIAVIN